MIEEEEFINYFNKESLKKIQKVFGPVTSESIETYGKILKFHDGSYRLRTIVNEWKEQKMLDRKTQRLYANILLSFLGLEILLAIIIVFLIGLKVLSFSEWIINTFFIGIFIKTASLVIIILKNLFSTKHDDLIKLLELKDGEL